jgi:hypothetical protein
MRRCECRVAAKACVPDRDQSRARIGDPMQCSRNDPIPCGRCVGRTAIHLQSHVGRLILAPRDPRRVRIGIGSFASCPTAGFIADRYPGSRLRLSCRPGVSRADRLRRLRGRDRERSADRQPLLSCRGSAGFGISALASRPQYARTALSGCRSALERLAGVSSASSKRRVSDRIGGSPTWSARVAVDPRPILVLGLEAAGGFARSLIQVEEIFPGEAVPTGAFSICSSGERLCVALFLRAGLTEGTRRPAPGLTERGDVRRYAVHGKQLIGAPLHASDPAGSGASRVRRENDALGQLDRHADRKVVRQGVVDDPGGDDAERRETRM